MDKSKLISKKHSSHPQEGRKKKNRQAKDENTQKKINKMSVLGFNMTIIALQVIGLNVSIKKQKLVSKL